MKRQNRFEVQQNLERGLVEKWPVDFKHPRQKNIRCATNLLTEIRGFFDDLYGAKLEFISPRIDKFGRCEVNGQKFSSDFNSTDRGSVVKVMFVDVNNELVPYYGIVRFYFTAKTIVEGEPQTHSLAYVTWLKPRSSSACPLSRLHGVTGDFYQSDRIVSPKRFLCRCILVSPNPAIKFSLVSELIK